MTVKRSRGSGGTGKLETYSPGRIVEGKGGKGVGEIPRGVRVSVGVAGVERHMYWGKGGQGDLAAWQQT